MLALPNGVAKTVDGRRLRGLRRARRRERASRSGARGSTRRSADVRRPRDLAALPPNDLASSPLAGELLRLGAFRADVSGAGPTVYGLFHHRRQAQAAQARAPRRRRDLAHRPGLVRLRRYRFRHGPPG